MSFTEPLPPVYRLNFMKTFLVYVTFLLRLFVLVGAARVGGPQRCAGRPPSPGQAGRHGRKIGNRTLATIKQGPGPDESM